MDDQRLRLRELAQRTGLESRTIRHYISIGLVPPPLSKGRDARYGKEHLERLQAIRVLRRKLKLEEIRDLFHTQGIPKVADTDGEDGLLLQESAQGYLASVKERFLSTTTRRPQSSHPPAMSASRGTMADWDSQEGADSAVPPSPADAEFSNPPLDQLIGLLKQGGSKHLVPRRGQPWHVIEIVPGMELHVKDQSESQLALMEQVCDLMRNIMTGGHNV